MELTIFASLITHGSGMIIL